MDGNGSNERSTAQSRATTRKITQTSTRTQTLVGALLRTYNASLVDRPCVFLFFIPSGVMGLSVDLASHQRRGAQQTAWSQDGQRQTPRNPETIDRSRGCCRGELQPRPPCLHTELHDGEPQTLEPLDRSHPHVQLTVPPDTCNGGGDQRHARIRQTACGPIS